MRRRRIMMQVAEQIPVNVNLIQDFMNGYINDSTGVYMGYHLSHSTDFLPVNTYNTFVVYAPVDTGFYAGKLYFYDSNKDYIKYNQFSAGEEVEVADIPDGACYVRFVVAIDVTDEAYYKRIA